MIQAMGRRAGARSFRPISISHGDQYDAANSRIPHIILWNAAIFYKEVFSVKIVVVKSPKALRGILRRIFGIK
jgi:hypothetical protein